ncbi:MAG: GNAT family N-acetyltransferase [Deltaproteobacteria bacterium]|nr:MAG: GNAT family N-acetyltransferase [Deltaproteobacteria bacterium]
MELTDGSEVWLRPMRRDDRDRLYNFFRKLPLRDRRYFKHDVTQREVITNWCRNLDYDQVLPILAVKKVNDHEKVVADATLHMERHGWSTHVAKIRMVIEPRLRNKGLGKALLRELHDRAVLRGIQKIQAEVRDDDRDAMALLKRLGFKKEAVLKKHIMDTSGRLHDMIIFYNDLSDLWKKMDDLNIEYDFHVVP